MLRLGVECDDEDYGKVFDYSDQNFECAIENEFFRGEKGDDYDVYICSSTAIVPSNSDGTAQTIDHVYIETDTRWLQYEEDEEYGGHCHSRIIAPPTPPPRRQLLHRPRLRPQQWHRPLLCHRLLVLPRRMKIKLLRLL